MCCAFFFFALSRDSIANLMLNVHITFELDLRCSMMSIHIKNDDDDEKKEEKEIGEAIKDVKECRTNKKIVNNTQTHSHAHTGQMTKYIFEEGEREKKFLTLNK